MEFLRKFLKRKTCCFYCFLTLLLCSVFINFGSQSIIASHTPVANIAVSLALSQTNWDGGSGESTTNQYSSATKVVSSTNGQVSMQWYNSNWPYRKKITIDASKVSADLTNFPVLITGDNFNSDFWNNVKSDGSDIVFTSSDGVTKLDRELVSISTGGQTMEAWVEVPSVLDATNTDIYAYYGYASASETNAAGTWGSTFKMVQHMQQNPGASAPQMTDSTSNDTDGTSVNTPITATGKIGNAVEFNGTNNYLNFGSATAIDDVTPFSISTWLYVDNAASDDHVILAKRESVNCAGRWSLVTNSNKSLAFTRFNTTSPVGATTAFSTYANFDQWYYVVMTWDGSLTASNIHMYVNGTEASYITQNNGVGSVASDGACILSAASRGEGNKYLDGNLDETRYINAVLASGWIATEYNNQNSPSTFYAVSAQETLSGFTGTLTSNIFDAGGTTHYWGIATYTTTNATGTSVKVRTSNSATMSGATEFASCSAITNDTDISTNNCVTDGHRYIQYQVNLTNSSGLPVFNDISMQYLTSQDQSVAESVGSLNLTVSIDTTSASSVTVPYVVSGTSSNPADHNRSSGNVLIEIGTLSNTIPITIVNDVIDESDETIVLTLGTPTNASLGNISNSTITIQDNDDLPGLSFALSSLEMRENAGPVTLTGTLSAVSGKEVTAQFAFGGSAINSKDYDRNSATLTIPAGSTTGAITFTPINDSDDDDNERIVMELISAANANVTGANSFVIYVVDDETTGVPLVAVLPVAPVVVQPKPVEVAKPEVTTPVALLPAAPVVVQPKPVEVAKPESTSGGAGGPQTDETKAKPVGELRTTEIVLKAVSELLDPREKIDAKNGFAPVIAETLINTPAQIVSVKPETSEVTSKPPVLENKLKIDEVKPGLVIENTVSVQDTNTKAFFTIEQSTQVEVQNNNQETARISQLSIEPPIVVQNFSNAPKGSSFASEVYQLGGKDEATLNFSKDVTVNLPLEKDIHTFASDEKLEAYYFDEESGKWIYQDNCKLKRLNGHFVCQFKTDHMTKFAVMKVKISFVDMDDHWARLYVIDLYNKGAISGYTDGTFRPDAFVSRAEYIKMIYKAFDKPLKKFSKTPVAKFKDLDFKLWYGPYVQAALKEGFVSGYADGTFKPDKNISRAEAVKILLNTTGAPWTSAQFSDVFEDVGENQWFAPYVMYIYDKKVINGYDGNKFRPNDKLTRAEAAKLLSSFNQL